MEDGRRVAVVGSGISGLAAAMLLTRLITALFDYQILLAGEGREPQPNGGGREGWRTCTRRRGPAATPLQNREEGCRSGQQCQMCHVLELTCTAC